MTTVARKPPPATPDPGTAPARPAPPVHAADPPPPPVKLNVFATVSAPIERQARAVSKLLFDQERLTTFPRSGHLLHVTLYLTRYPANAIATVRKRVAAFAAGVHPFEVLTTGVAATAGNWLFLNLSRSRDLQALSDRLVELLEPLRDPEPPISDWARGDPAKVAAIRRHGSPNVFDQFAPHLTLLAETEESVLTRFLAANARHPALAEHVTGELIAIGLGVADDQGQIASPLALHPLTRR